LSFKNSRDNLIANIAQQSIGLLMAIVMPLLLSVGEYAQVTVVSVLIAFMPLADLGMGIIYSRKLPALYSAQNIDEVNMWNATVSRFKLYTALIFSVLISGYYLVRYQSVLNAVLLFCFAIFTAMVSYVIANATVQSNFRFIKNLTIIQVFAKLTVLPGVWIAGVKGWFIGQLFSVLAVFIDSKLRLVLHQSLSKPDWNLVKVNILHGMTFSMVATLWLQLSLSGRLYASFAYPDAIVAQYGLVSSIYQIVVALSIAAFVPQTIKIYRLIEENQVAAINYVMKLTIYSAPVFMLFGLFLTYISPIVIEIIYPKYNVDKALYAPIMLSLFNAGLMVVLGTLLIGFGKAKLYLLTVVMGCIAYLGYVFVLSATSGYHAAAIAQLLALSTYSIAMLFLLYFVVKDKVDNKTKMFLSGFPSILAPLIYFLVFYV
jgi:O-antigen/teichoic acid export membrane protein